MTNGIQSFVYDPQTTICYGETYLPEFPSNSEAYTSELLENLEQLFLWYYINNDMFSRLKSSTTQDCVTRREIVNAFML